MRRKIKRKYYVFVFIILYVACSRPSEPEFDNPYDDQSDAFIPHPDLVTLEVDSIRAFEAWSGGEFANDYGHPVTAKGVCWSSEENPSIGDDCTNDGEGLEAFESHLNDLEPDQQYYVRAYANKKDQLIYGDIVEFTTKSLFVCGDEIKDIEGYTYQTVEIGNQCWMAENLNSSKYNDGTEIPNVIDNDKWPKLTTGGWAYAYHNSKYGEHYGKLYNWFTVNDERGLCPNGWKVASDIDWKELELFLGMDPDEVDSTSYRRTGAVSDKLKSDPETWKMPRDRETNQSGFTAKPGGFLSTYSGRGSFVHVHMDGKWWTSTEVDTNHAWQRGLSDYWYGVGRENFFKKSTGKSVRCILNKN